MIKRIVAISTLSVLLILFFLSEISKPQKRSWELNFSGISREPYGCYVLRETLEDNQTLNFDKTTNETFYNAVPSLNKNKNQTLILITDKFDADSLNLSLAYKFVAGGNNIFISAYAFPEIFKDSLHFEVKFFDLKKFNAATDSVNFTNPSLKLAKPLVFEKTYPSRFSGIDTARHLILGSGNRNSINYIKVPYGKGAFYLHCQPLLFTNYHMLNQHPDYAYLALSYFKNSPLVWDDYYKPKAGKYNPESQTPLRYFLSQAPLKSAIYLTILLIIIYFFIESKRKQRFVPIITPLENSTIKFVNTIARLYLGNPDYKKMALRKYQYLKEMVYSRYLLRLDENNPDTARIFSEKTGYSVQKIKELFVVCRRIESSISIDAETLIELSRQIDDIYAFEKK